MSTPETVAAILAFALLGFAVARLLWDVGSILFRHRTKLEISFTGRDGLPHSVIMDTRDVDSIRGSLAALRDLADDGGDPAARRTERLAD